MNNGHTEHFLTIKLLLTWAINGGIVVFATQLQPILSCIVLLLTAAYTAYKLVEVFRGKKPKE